MDLENGTWELRLGSALDGLAALGDNAIDHTICDPPYSAHVHTSFRSVARGGGVKKNAMGFAHFPAGARRKHGAQIARVTRLWILVFSDMEGQRDWHNALEKDGHAEHVRFGLWDRKGTGAPQTTGDRPAAGAEAIEIAHGIRQKGEGRMVWNGGGKDGVWRCNVVPGRRRRHVTEKPLQLMEALIRDFTQPGDLVCDPYAGSGTTGVAAMRAGRRFLGWEVDPRVHEIARRRLAATNQQSELFNTMAPLKRRQQLRLELDT